MGLWTQVAASFLQIFKKEVFLVVGAWPAPYELSCFQSLLSDFVSLPCWLDLEALCLGLTGAPGPGHRTISRGHRGHATTADEQEHAAWIPQEGKLRVGVSGDQEAQGHREQQSRVRTLRLCGNVRDSNYPLSLLSTMW